MKKFILILELAIIKSVFAVNPIPPVPGAPQAGNYYINGTYGSTMTVNGNTTYYSNGQYQGQSPANGNNPIFQNRNQQSIINTVPSANNNQEQLMNSSPTDSINAP